MELANEKLEAVTVILRTSQKIEEIIRNDVARHGLNVTEFSVLQLLYKNGHQPIQLIGKKVLIASSSITYVIDKLQEKNYVKRQACAEDRRVTYAALTNEGKNLMDEIYPQYKVNVSKNFGDLDFHEVQQLIALLKRI